VDNVSLTLNVGADLRCWAPSGSGMNDHVLCGSYRGLEQRTRALSRFHGAEPPPTYVSDVVWAFRVFQRLCLFKTHSSVYENAAYGLTVQAAQYRTEQE